MRGARAHWGCGERWWSMLGRDESWASDGPRHRVSSASAPCILGHERAGKISRRVTVERDLRPFTLYLCGSPPGLKTPLHHYRLTALRVLEIEAYTSGQGPVGMGSGRCARRLRDHPR